LKESNFYAQQLNVRQTETNWLTSNSTGRHLSNAVLKLLYLTGASLNICKWLCNALPVF